MHRFYSPQADFRKKTVRITDKNELHHLRNVLRLNENDPVHLFDGMGKEARGTIVSMLPHGADVQINSVKTFIRTKPILILACAMPKKSKFELIIEKATELGVDEIIPLKTKRTEIHLDGARMTRKIARFNTVTVNASKQSRRSVIPIIHPITDIKSALEHLTKISIVIIPSLPEKSTSLLSVLQKLKTPQAVSFVIGPEGDFTAEEYALARKSGCIPVTLGETILKVETAALCALSCANLFFHNYRPTHE
jgi:16S rRNA (uracil1498-N3)-methyltransferase